MSNIFKKVTISAYLIVSLALLLFTIYEPAFLVITIGLFVFGFLFFLFISGKLHLIHFVGVLIPSIILSPSIPLPGLPSIRIDDIWLAFGTIVLIVLASKSKKISIVFPLYAKLYLLFIAWIAITIYISSNQEPYFYSNRDWLEVYKNIKLLVILLIGSNVKINKNRMKSLVKVLLLSLLVTSMFGFMQFFNLFNVNSWLTPYFVYKSKVYGLESLNRVVGTFGNPNVLASALLIGIAFSFSSFLSSFKVRYLLLLTIFFSALTTTMSRTAIVSGALLLIIIFFTVMSKTKKKLSTLFVVSFVPIAILLALKFAPSKFFYRMSFLNDLSSDNSSQVRISNWATIFQARTKDHIIAGTGPVSKLQITFDNEWLMLLTQYGMIGVVLFVLLFTVIYFKLGKMSSIDGGYTNIAMRGLIIVYAISMITMPIFQQLQLMPIVILLIGLALNKNKP